MSVTVALALASVVAVAIAAVLQWRSNR